MRAAAFFDQARSFSLIPSFHLAVFQEAGSHHKKDSDSSRRLEVHFLAACQ